MPRPNARQLVRREGGTASVELIAVVPFLLLAVLIAAQIAIAGQALWSASLAARAGARAALVGGDATKVARRALPPSMRPGSVVEDSGAVSVEVRVPTFAHGLPSLGVEAKASLGGDG
ncbi:MAG TPA: hypothetical protein VII45_06360 [Solirubrobacterales bacterium]